MGLEAFLPVGILHDLSVLYISLFCPMGCLHNRLPVVDCSVVKQYVLLMVAGGFPFRRYFARFLNGSWRFWYFVGFDNAILVKPLHRSNTFLENTRTFLLLVRSMQTRQCSNGEAAMSVVFILPVRIISIFPLHLFPVPHGISSQ